MSEGVSLITPDNRMEQKLFLVVSGRAEVPPERDDKSVAGWYKTVHDEDDYQKTFEKDRYDGLN